MTDLAKIEEYFGRFSALTDALGPLQPADELENQVTRLLLASADNLGISLGIVEATTGLEAIMCASDGACTNCCERRGHVLILPVGDELQFHQLHSFVSDALSCLGLKDDEDPSPGMLLVVTSTDLSQIVDKLPEVPTAPQRNSNPATPPRDLLNGRSAASTVCFLPDVEDRVEQLINHAETSDSPAAQRFVVELVVPAHCTVPASLSPVGDAFFDHAEQLLTQAEQLWYDRKPPAEAAAKVPTDSPLFAGCAAVCGR